jgi:hypothetical protein
VARPHGGVPNMKATCVWMDLTGGDTVRQVGRCGEGAVIGSRRTTVPAVPLMSYCCMATYTIIPRSGADGYDIGVIGADGIHQTMLGFKTKAAAQEWIAHDQALGDRVRGTPK